MIEEVCTSIIKELGPTGLLIIGMFFIAERYCRHLCNRIGKINDELGEIVELLKKLTNKKTL